MQTLCRNAVEAFHLRGFTSIYWRRCCDRRHTVQHGNILEPVSINSMTNLDGRRLRAADHIATVNSAVCTVNNGILQTLDFIVFRKFIDI